MTKIGFGTPGTADPVVARSSSSCRVEEPEGQSAERDPEVPWYSYGASTEGSAYE